MTDLSWRDAYPDDPLFRPGAHLVLERARDGEPEAIGTVLRCLRPGLVEAWSWSLTCTVGPLVGYPRPGFAASGSCDTQREARTALIAAWRHEEAYRAEVRASPIFDSLGGVRARACDDRATRAGEVGSGGLNARKAPHQREAGRAWQMIPCNAR